MKVADIRHEKDLHTLSFSDLFYEIYGEPNGEAIAMKIIRLIMPDFDDVYREGRIEAAQYSRLLDHLTYARLKRSLYSRSLYSRAGGDLYYSHLAFEQWASDLVMDSYGSHFERLFNEGNFETICNALYKEYTDERSPEEGEKRHHYLIATLVKDEERYNEFCEKLRSKISYLATKALRTNKVIKGLFLLPKLKSDQELIIFFGHNFGATFNSVDAYSGLLYASEFFDFDGVTLSSLVSRFEVDEIEAAKQAEAKEREERAQRKAERKKSEQYNSAIKTLENGSYESAYRMFCELGDYRNAKSKAEEAKAKYEEEARIDSIRSSIRAEASKIMQPVIVKDWHRPCEHRVSWRILDVDVSLGRALMITEECIGNRSWGRGTWSECSLRKWLNEEFYSSLPEEVRVRVATTKVQDINANKTVGDKVFILSVDEVHKYFRGESVRRCRNAGEMYSSSWWMRELSPDKMESSVRVVDEYGKDGAELLCSGRREDPPTRDGYSLSTAVRPALWVQTGLDDAALSQRRSEEKLVSSYALAKQSMYGGDYKKARDEFGELGDYKDSKSLADLCSKGVFFAKATELMDSAKTEREFREAIAGFEKAGDFYLCTEDGYRRLCATESKAQCEKLAKIAMLSESLIKLADMRPAKPSAELPEEEIVKCLERERRDMQEELNGLGLFKGKEKQSLREGIEKKSDEIRDAVSQAEKARKAAEARYEKKHAEYKKHVKSFIAMIKIGDEINVGGSNRTMNRSKKPWPYTWRVQAVEGDQILLVLSQHTRYHDKIESVNWVNCALRSETIASMLRDHFTEAEKSLLKKVSHSGVSDLIFTPSKQEIARFGLKDTWLRGSVNNRGLAPYAYGTGYISSEKCTESKTVKLLAWLDFS